MTNGADAGRGPLVLKGGTAWLSRLSFAGRNAPWKRKGDTFYLRLPNCRALCRPGSLSRTVPERQTDTAQAISDAEDATQAANDAAALANQNVLALQFDQDTGILSALVGQDGSAFESGTITDTGEVVLNFNYE